MNARSVLIASSLASNVLLAGIIFFHPTLANNGTGSSTASYLNNGSATFRRLPSATPLQPNR